LDNEESEEANIGRLKKILFNGEVKRWDEKSKRRDERERERERET
jgi:hypothetical protein